jgi:UDP-glucuronate 4-epimerase
MTKKILITGAAGFIGHHLAKRLAARGDAVQGYDAFNDYYDPGLKWDRVEQLPQVEVIEADLCDFAMLKRVVDEFRPTHLVNLAAQAGVRYSLENPHAYMQSNLVGFLNVLEVCRAHPGLKLIYASSSSVYGTNTKTPYAEEDRTDSQASLYGVTKRCNELMADTYHRLYGIPVTGLRFFTVYGPWGRPDMAYFSFTRKILAGEPIALYNNGQMMRDFTYIDDIVDGTIAAIDLGADNAIFNLGNHQPVSLMEFVGVLERLLGREAQKDFLPMQKGDVLQTYAAIDNSHERLGFQPKTSLEAGMKQFVNWYKDYFSC